MAIPRRAMAAASWLGQQVYLGALYGVIGMFNIVDRIADAIGIPLDEPLALMSAGVRAELSLARFASAANSRQILGE